MESRKTGLMNLNLQGSNGDATPSCPSGSDGKEPACSAGDPGSIPGLGRSPGGGNGNPLQYSYLDRGESHGQRSLMGYSPWDHKESDTTEQLTLSLLMEMQTEKRLMDTGGWVEGEHGMNEETSIYTAAAAKSLQSCPTLCDPIDSSPPGSPVPGIPQARTLEWVAISFSSA